MNQIYIYIFEYKKEGGIIMPNLILDNEESLVLKKMIARAEAERIKIWSMNLILDLRRILVVVLLIRNLVDGINTKCNCLYV